MSVKGSCLLNVNSCIIAHRPKALDSSLQDYSRLFLRTQNKVLAFLLCPWSFPITRRYDCSAQEEECWCHVAGTAAPLWQGFVLKRLPSCSNSLTNMETSKDSCSLPVLLSAWPRPCTDLLRSNSLLIDLIKTRETGHLLFCCAQKALSSKWQNLILDFSVWHIKIYHKLCHQMKECSQPGYFSPSPQALPNHLNKNW